MPSLVNTTPLLDATIFAVEEKAIFFCCLHQSDEIIIMFLNGFAKDTDVTVHSYDVR